jgi:hypothetical protein
LAKIGPSSWEKVARNWWELATEQANELRLGEIEQEGRSGGWLVFSDGRDPLDFGGKARIEWLRAYKAMVKWCEESIAAVPDEIGRTAVELANAMAVAP